MERIPYLGQTIYKWEVGASTFLALPEKGARLMNWNVTLGDGTVRDIIYWPEVGSLDNFPKIRGGNPILFPFVARTYDRGELGQWKADDGIRRPMPMHGFARQGAFRITRMDEGGFSAMLVPDAEAKAAYPYDYEFTVSYRFEPTGLYVELELMNRSAAPIPWCAGHHFYLTVPWSPGCVRRDYQLAVPATRTLKHNESGRLVDGPRLGPSEPLDNPALIDTIQTGLRGHAFTLTEKPSGQQIRFNTGFTNTTARDAAVVTWTEDAKSPFFCLEPWMGPPNSPENKTGLHLVGAGQTQKFLVEIELD
ncbi:MAG TPA: aldose epimerase [Candidatus Didemnitutus sp.]|nr:aldose epimerase [Candidatus Didemnitutus sp.]